MHRVRFIVGGLILLACCQASVAQESQEELLGKAADAAQQRDSKAAVRWATQAIDAGDAPPVAFYLRGRERLRLAEFSQAVDDFDQYIRLKPAIATRMWERGIACYYAGKFKEGVQQFRDYQTYHGNDVENAVWFVACLAKVDGLKKAQTQILPIPFDRRVPMMEIYNLYRGAGTAEQVMEAVKKGDPTPQQLNDRLMYAHLYLGLYYELLGDEAKSLAHMKTCAEQHKNGNYMWDVARVHAAARSAAAKSPPKADSNR